MTAAILGLLLGLVLGAGLVLTVSPWIWPPGETAARRRVTALGAALSDRLVQAGLRRVPPSLLLTLSGLLGISAGAAAAGLSRIPALGLVVGTVAAALPPAVVSGRARRSLRAARASWPDLVDHLVAGLRAGLSLSEAVASLARIGPPGLRHGFAEFERVLRVRGAVDPALDALQTALADPVADRVTEALRLARELGGTELPGILRGLAASLRQEAAARGEAEARQSWVIAAARLGVVAPWLVLLVLAVRPEAAGVYASPGGTVLVLGGFVVTLVAYRLMLSVGRLPEEQRRVA